jgi:hypothetical protein
MRDSLTHGVILLATLGLLAGCADPPEEASQRAAEAVQAARDAEAETYAVPELREAESSLAAAEQATQAQNERFAILRDYEEAEKMLAETQVKAQDARQRAIEGKEEARLVAEGRLGRLHEALGAAQTALDSAPRGKGTRADIAALTADLDGIRAELPDLEAQIESEEYFAARDKADSMIELAESISEEIQVAVETQARILEKRRGR